MDWEEEGMNGMASRTKEMFDFLLKEIKHNKKMKNVPVNVPLYSLFKHYQRF